MKTILELRKITGLSQRKFADKYNIHFRSIQNWEQGVSKPPKSLLLAIERLITEVDYAKRDTH